MLRTVLNRDHEAKGPLLAAGLFSGEMPKIAKQLVFVDGVGGKRYMRGKLIRHFEQRGYSVRCFDYSASSQSLTDIKARLAALLREVAAQGDYAAMGYSFGGVLLRLVLQESAAALPPPRRMVLLASPLTSMRLASRLKNWRIYKLMTGECGQLAANTAEMAKISFPAVPTACIYGTWPWLGALGLFAGFKLPHDGMVAADEAAPGRFALAAPIRASHAFIPAHPAALAAASGWFEAA
ncbi:esterase/lipase family protein [Roseateles sp. NT4]|uniref:esterase/lipase family protein n=1 Tax=Roseateles sp. NT4 TaxID=3453715 RepID=UPI003F711116